MPVLVDVDGQTAQWRTREADLDEVLNEMGVSVGANDTSSSTAREVARRP